ncbi:unnamed protein product, partial [Rotaria sordida]
MRLIIQLTLVYCICAAASATVHESYDEIYQRVGQYLKNSQQAGRSNLLTLENSNTIGLGYDPLHGSPVCYTGACQMSGFRQPVFKLNYIQIPEGSCTSKLIPEHVSLHCITSTEIQAGTEVIDTLDRLMKTTTNGLEIGVG